MKRLIILSCVQVGTYWESEILDLNPPQSPPNIATYFLHTKIYGEVFITTLRGGNPYPVHLSCIVSQLEQKIKKISEGEQ